MARRRRSRRSRWRLRDIFVTLAFFGVLILGISFLEQQNERNVESAATVVDGDSLEINKESYRLLGIDAPEFNQTCTYKGRDWPCGRDARRSLQKMVRNKVVHCSTNSVDKYDRWLAVCKTDDGEINSRMVLQGWAVDFGGYRREETIARRNRVGIWKGEFDDPSDWRRVNAGQRFENTEARKLNLEEWVRQFWQAIQSWWTAL